MRLPITPMTRISSLALFLLAGCGPAAGPNAGSQPALPAAKPEIASATEPQASGTGGGAHREVGSHVHGEAVIALVLSGDELTVELHSPVFNILGFESAPSTAAEQVTAATAANQLKNAESIVVPTAAAQCLPTSADADLPTHPAETSATHEGTENVHDHDHEEGEDGDHNHPDLTATYTFKCSRADNLGEVTITALRTFPGIRTAEVAFIGPTAQMSRKLDASAPLFRVR